MNAKGSLLHHLPALKKLIDEGLNNREIAARLGLTWEQVRGLRKRNGLPVKPSTPVRPSRREVLTAELRRSRLELLVLRACGYSTTEAARQLGIPYETARSRINSLLAELGARTAAHATVIAAVDGLLSKEQIHRIYSDRITR